MNTNTVILAGMGLIAVVLLVKALKPPPPPPPDYLGGALRSLPAILGAL